MQQGAMIKRIVLQNCLTVCICFAWLAGCTGPPKLSIPEEILPDTTSVAFFSSDSRLTLGQLRHALDSSMLVPWGGIVDDSVACNFRDSILLDTLAGLAAADIDLMQHYLSYRLYQRMYYEFLIKAFWEEIVFRPITVDSTEVIEFYQNNLNLFLIKEQVKMYQIMISRKVLLSSPDSLFFLSMDVNEFGDWIREYVHNIHRLLKFGEVFENVAYVYSHDAASREKGGYVGFTVRGVYLDPFDSVAFNLSPGEFSEPYEDADGWHILYISEYLTPGPAPIDSASVYESARQTLLTKKGNIIARRINDSLQAATVVTYNEEVRDVDFYTLDDQQWVAVVNGSDTLDVRYLKQYEIGFRDRNKVTNTVGEMREQLIMTALAPFRIVQLARASRTDTLPEVVKRHGRLLHHRSKVIIRQRAYARNWKADDQQLEEYYKNNLDKYIVKKPLKFEHIIVADSSFAEFLYEQAGSGIDLNQLAAEQQKLTGMKIRHIPVTEVSREDVTPQMWIALSGTPRGHSTPPIKTHEGYVVAKLIDKQESKSFRLAKGDIRAILRKQNNHEVWVRERDYMFDKYGVRIPRDLPPIRLEQRGIRLKLIAQ